MKNKSIISKIGMAALLIALFSFTILFTNGTSNKVGDNVESKDEIVAQKLASNLMVDEQLRQLQSDLTDEGVLSSNKDIMVKILNMEDVVVYEGTYNELDLTDKALRRYMVKADLLINVENVAYYMLF